MICGCCVACTDNPGFSCMVKHEETGLLSPVYDVYALTKNILRLIGDSSLRIKLAKAGNKIIEQFTWENAVQKFEELLNDDAV